MSPEFHSAALLVHLSWLCVAIRRACRHLFQFLQNFNPICDAVCQHFFISFFRASLYVLDYESKDSALCSAEHFFDFFCCSPCPGSARYCKCENSVESVQSVS